MIKRKLPAVVRADPIAVWVPEIYEHHLTECLVSAVHDRAKAGLPPYTLEDAQAARHEMAGHLIDAMILAGNC